MTRVITTDVSLQATHTEQDIVKLLSHIYNYLENQNLMNERQKACTVLLIPLNMLYL